MLNAFVVLGTVFTFLIYLWFIMYIVGVAYRKFLVKCVHY